MLIRKSDRRPERAKRIDAVTDEASGKLDRRTFLKQSGITAGALAAVGELALHSVRRVEAGPPPPVGASVTIRKNICTHCSVGCSVIAKVANGV